MYPLATRINPPTVNTLHGRDSRRELGRWLQYTAATMHNSSERKSTGSCACRQGLPSKQGATDLYHSGCGRAIEDKKEGER